MHIDLVLVIVGALLFLSVIASKASARLGVPALLLFLIVGMLAGSEGPGGISFDDVEFAQEVGIIALALILFSGGLDTEWKSVRAVLPRGIALGRRGWFSPRCWLGSSPQVSWMCRLRRRSF